MAVSTIKGQNVIEATFNHPTGTNVGSLKYIQEGLIVTFSGQVQLTANVNANTILFSGLPMPSVSGLVNCRVFNSSAGTYVDGYIGSEGTFRNSGTWSNGFHRINGTYIVS